MYRAAFRRQEKNIKPLRLHRGIFFVFSCMGVPFFLSPVGCEPYVACRTFLFAYSQVTFFLMNALVHFVHWTIPLYLFLVYIPHGRDINHS